MKTKIAFLLTYVFFPGNMVLFAFIFIHFPQFPNLQEIASVLLNYIILPISLVYFFVKMRWLSNIHLPLAEERWKAYFVSIFFGCVQLFIFKNSTELYFSYSLTALTVLIVLFVATLFLTKVSAHAAGVASAWLWLFLENKNSPYIHFVFLGIGISVIWARYVLKAHTKIQLFLGTCIGLLCTFAIWKILISNP